MANKREKVVEAAVVLVKLTEKPEPGLAVWHEMCERAYQALVAAATEPDAGGLAS